MVQSGFPHGWLDMWICCTVSEWWLWFWVGFHSVWGLPKVLGTTLSNVSWKSTIARNIIKHYCKKHFCTLVLMHVYFWILKYCILILGYQPESTFLDRHVGKCGYSLSYSTNLSGLCGLDQGGSPSQKCWLPVLLWPL